ncbi:hypothetical protein O6H91_23G020100 [Diphasiastrum complanatum]|uniref:Uncharacterized protein n=1 Tax=Diphasiastrum complanatum TaxID=34168 RepID=A0ACC2A8U4_DIPCM|nr:hypothetical protein O6H91_23G020100 [Diphasiastrum complanatum]
MLDLSYDHLRVLDGLEALQFLVHLSLSQYLVSCVHTLRPISKLQRLRSLDISHNKLTGNSYTGSSVYVAVCWDLSSKNRMATPSSHTFEYFFSSNIHMAWLGGCRNSHGMARGLQK